MGFQRRLSPLLTGLSVALLVLLSGVALVQPTDLSALAHHPHLCQTTREADGHHYPGFFCPRLSDAPEEAYCCHLQAAGGSCCTQDEFEALYQVNLSALPPAPIFRGPGPLLALGLYSLLLVALMTADLVHFCRGRGRGGGPGRRRGPCPGRGRVRALDRWRRGPPARSSAARPLQVWDGGDVKALYRRSQAQEKLGRLDQAVLDLQRCVSLEPKNKVFQEALRDIGGQIQEKTDAWHGGSRRCGNEGEGLEAVVGVGGECAGICVTPEGVRGRLPPGAREGGAGSGFRVPPVPTPRLLARQKQLSSEGQTAAGRLGDAMARLFLPGVRYMSSTDAKVEQMFQILLDPQEKGTEKKQKASQNLVVLAREDAGAEKIFRSNGVQLLQRLLDTGEADLMLAALRTLVGICSEHQSRTVATLSVLGTRRVVSILGVESPAVSLAACHLLQVMFDVLKEGVRKGFRGKEGAIIVDPARELKVLIGNLLELLTEEGVSGQGRDNALTLLIKVVPRKSPKDPNNSLTLWVIDQGLKKILEVGGSVQDAPGELSVTAGSRMSASILLSKLFDDLKCDGLCKLGSAGGTDFSMKQFAEGSTLRLAKQCRKWLCNDQMDAGTRRWAVEGLAYLTFDADVKEEFVEDAAALKALFQLSKLEERSVLFAVASALVNCTNSYDYEEPDPKMVELAKYAKQHVPEQHPKDKPSFVRARVKKLLAAGVVSALTCMVKAESPALTSSCRELLSRVFLALVEEVEDRGTVVAQGGGKALLPLALEGTDVGQTKAAQALAKLTITSNPEMTFPGERIYEVVRPLVSLLHLNCSGLQNFEALMALTNLAGISERLRQKILKEKAVPMIEGYMFEEHEMIRRAATECMSNLAMSKEVQDLFEAPDNDRLKLLVLYSGEDDELLRRAAAGGLAVLTCARPSLCSRIPQVTSHWLEILQALLLSPSQELQHRGAVVVLNMVEASPEVAGTLMQSEVLEILSVLAKGKDGPVTRAATACLGKAVDYGLIQPRQDVD
ncbi:PREDICTED: protein unc-45 homolog A [Condylura cristata]|uniref:protein unc-45 homolog A n=1 Tax=Condylura cristata TaxID=143302 RepID=UPI000642ADB3|nr:PREDICTED: protein unc-45 homolog A [Condylura cristata]